MKRTIALLATVCLLACLAVSSTAYAVEIEVGPIDADPSTYETIDTDDYTPQALAEDTSDPLSSLSLQSTSGSVTYLSISIEQMASLEYAKGSNKYGGSTATYSQILNALDPNNVSLSEFADITVPSGLTASQIDAFIDSTSKGRSGTLHGMGNAFIEAERTYGVSAAYLVAHAVLESGWGTSTLSRGYYYDGTIEIGKGSNKRTYPAGTYYNFFGIGASDSSPLSGGRSLAIQNGWTSPEAAVLGGAKWISTYYLHRTDDSYAASTIYNMRWDYNRANDYGCSSGSAWHEYATDVQWPESIANLMDSVYAKNNVEPSYAYIIPCYAGSSVPSLNGVAMYRLYNPNSGEHFYTSSVVERSNLVSLGWQQEGIGWIAPNSSSTPVYRLYNPNGGDHHYTLSAEERDGLVALGWRYEGIGWYSDDSKSVPLYRQYNPNATSGSHNFTASAEERDWLISLGWNDEGIAWYGIS